MLIEAPDSNDNLGVAPSDEHLHAAVLRASYPAP